MSILENPVRSNGACFAIVGKELLMKKDNSMLSFDDLCELKRSLETTDFFEEKAFDICALSLKNKENIPDAYEVKTIRQFFSEHDEKTNFQLARSRALISWRRDYHFCSCCGAVLSDHEDFTARVCPSCQKLYFPRIEPCIIVLVRKGDKVLLARHVQRNQDVYACIAGFIEVGESAECAVKREVFEEVGIRVKNIQYRGSQSWPFPDQLMLAFTAEYESGEIKLQENEIADAQWFDRDDCPTTPQPGSVAYKLIHNEI